MNLILWSTIEGGGHVQDTTRGARLIGSLPPYVDLIRGSLVRYHHEGCRCHPNVRYGPYCYLSVNRRSLAPSSRDPQTFPIGFPSRN